MFPPGIEPGTFRVLGGCDNHYTTETELRSEAGETARLLQAGILCHKQSLATGQDLDIWSIPHGNGLKRGLSGLKQTFPKLCLSGRDRLVVRTLRCGRSNPGSNPGHGMDKIFFSKASNIKMRILTKHASAGNRTRVNCLEGSYAHHYTTDAGL